MIENVNEGFLSSTTYTLIKYPTKTDTLKMVTYLVGGSEYFKNGGLINAETYNSEIEIHR